MYSKIATLRKALRLGQFLRAYRLAAPWAAMILVAALWALSPGLSSAMTPASEDDPSTVSVPESGSLIPQTGQSWTGDLPELRKRGVIRVLVEYSRTDFFVVRGELYGFEYELLKEYETFLNRKRNGALRMRVVFVPMPFGDLIPALVSGKGDIAAAGITITPEREEQVAFSAPYIDQVSEVLVTPKGVDAPRSFEDLSGRAVYVLRGSSHAEHLQKLNRALAQKGARQIEVVEAPNEFTAEDLLEMANASIFQNVIVDSHTANLWAKVLPNIAVHSNIELSNGGKIAWAVRKESKELLASINDFLHKDKDAALAKAQQLIPKYYENTQWVVNPNGNEYTGKLRQYAEHFKAFCRNYDFDWLMAAALAFRESHFEEHLVSRTGAVGLMQVLPATGAELGFHNLKPPKQNIQAGVCYLSFLKSRYFSDDSLPDDQKIYFILAAYNAGPNRVNRLRRIAQEMGLNPNVWFGNVEYVAMDAIGEEVLSYVANINKYYAAYKRASSLVDKRFKAREEILRINGPSPQHP